MLMRCLFAGAVFLASASAVAQELSVVASPPLDGSLLVHTGTFSAQRSVVESTSCPRGESHEKRQQTAEIVFDPPFREIPQVLVALNELDFGVHDETYREVRVRARAEKVTREAMTLIVETWCDTNMYGSGGTYFAMGQRGEIQGGRSPQVPLAASEQPKPPIALEQLGPPPPFEEPGFDSIDSW